MPQFEQAAARAVPQFKQNFAPSGFTVWQMGQFIGVYRNKKWQENKVAN